LNRLFRLAYLCAYRAARVWWFLRRPHTHAAVVALWHQGSVLLVRSSYRPHHALPGGFLNRGETSRQAALRELFEELAVRVAPASLTMAWEGSIPFEHRTDSVTIWAIDVDARPDVRVDGRELVWAGWKTPAEARTLLLLPPVRAYLTSVDEPTPRSDVR